jgi:hypothetical protein
MFNDYINSEAQDAEKSPGNEGLINLLREAMANPPDPMRDPLARKLTDERLRARAWVTRWRRERRFAIAAGVTVAALSIFTADRFNRNAVAHDALAAVRAEVVQLHSELAELRRLIGRSGLEDTVRVADPPFLVAGREVISIGGSADPRYIAKVTAQVGQEHRVLYERQTPAERAAHEPFKEGKFTVPLGSGQVDAVLDITPFPEVAQQFPQFFGPAQTHRQQTFLATSYGLIANPTKEDLEGVADLETIELRADAENPTRYTVGGFLRRTGDHRHAWLIIDPIDSGQMYVGSTIAIDPDDPEFRARCFLGTRIDRGEFHLFVVTSADPNALQDGQQINKPFDWEAHGFRKSQGRFKLNDGQDGFTQQP